MAGSQKQERKQEQFIANLLNTATIAQAAKASGISEATAGRWLKEPAFLQAYNDARSHLLRHAVGVLANGLTAGAVVLRSIVQGDGPPAAKVAAIRLMYDIILRNQELEVLEARILGLEAKVAAHEVPHGP